MTSSSRGRALRGRFIQSRSIASHATRVCLELLDCLGVQERALATFPFDNTERTSWHYVPKARSGLALKQMDVTAQTKTHELLATVLSSTGTGTVENVMEHELILGAMERSAGNPRHDRDPELYYLSVFGEVGGPVWGWRFEGHHLSLHFTIVDGEYITTLPSFLGANPATVLTGSKIGMRILAPLEDRARSLMGGLNADQRDRALLSDRAPADIITSNDRRLSLRNAEGLPGASLMGHQRALLMALLEAYTGRLHPELAEQYMAVIRDRGLDSVHFAWAGALEPGKPHYYRLQGTTFFAEYDNVQNGANHIHTVWRDAAQDFGEDVLRVHYEREHGRPEAAERRLS